MNKQEIENITFRLEENLGAIRRVLDLDVENADIEVKKKKLIRLTSLVGNAAQAKADAKRILLAKELEIFESLQEQKLTPTIMLKKLSALCHEQESLYVYADRINAGISHAIEGLRTYISLYKTELENSLKA